jgi:hypothetical protein
LIIGIAVHYGRRSEPGEKKNLRDPMRWLRFGQIEGADSWKPVMVFSPVGAFRAEVNCSPEMDLRAFANRAAGQPGWRFLSAEVREKLATLPTLRGIKVGWTETPGGDAAALDLYHSGTLGLASGTPCDFIIGNGRRGEDGRVEPTRHWLEGRNRNAQPVVIALIGEKKRGKPTAAQEAALGELIAALEARNGNVILTMHEPRHQDLLADAN